MHLLKPSLFVGKLEACFQFSINRHLSLSNDRKSKVDTPSKTLDSLFQHWKSIFIDANVPEPEESIEHLLSASLHCSRVRVFFFF